MSEREAFLSKIRAQPEEDSHRLVFADWLDDHNEPKTARLLRGEVLTLRRMQNDPHDATAQALHACYEAALRPVLTPAEFEVRSHKLNDSDIYVSRWSRGLPHTLRCGTTSFLAHEKMLSSCPYIRGLHLSTENEFLQLEKCLAKPAWAERLESLSIDRAFYLNYAHLPKLKTLEFRQTLEDEYVSVLADDADHAPALESLTFKNANALTPACIPSLARMAQRLPLNHLAFSGLHDAAATALAASPALQNINSLELRNLFSGVFPIAETSLSDGFCQALAHSPYAGNLESLALFAQTGITDTGHRALLHSPKLTSLRDLDLSFSFAPLQSAEAFRNSPVAKRLERLNVTCYFQAPDAGMPILARYLSAPRLHTLAAETPHSEARKHALVRILEKCPVENLSLETAGNIPSETGEMLGQLSERARERLRSLDLAYSFQSLKGMPVMPNLSVLTARDLHHGDADFLHNFQQIPGLQVVCTNIERSERLSPHGMQMRHCPNLVGKLSITESSGVRLWPHANQVIPTSALTTREPADQLPPVTPPTPVPGLPPAEMAAKIKSFRKSGPATGRDGS